MTRAATPLRDRELLDLLADEPELLAIADAIATTEPPAITGGGRRRRRLLPATVAVGAVTAVAVSLALLWPFSSSPSILDNALAAVPSGTVAHLIVEDNLGSTLLDVKSGRQSPASGRLSIFYARNYGMLVKTSFLGVEEMTGFVSANVLRLAGPRQTPFVVQYRNALRNHELHVTGSGTYRGVPVYWIETTPYLVGRVPDQFMVEQVAISKATYKPLFYRRLIDGKVVPGSSERVILIGTASVGPAAVFRRAPHVPPFSSDIGYFNGVVQYEPLTLTQAKAIRPKLLIPRKLGGLRLSFVAHAPYTSGPGFIREIPGVLLYYGATYNPGIVGDTQPGYRSRWIQIIEFPHANAVTRAFRGHFRNDGRAVISGLAADIGPRVAPIAAAQFGATQLTAQSATLKSHGRYFLINAATRSDAIAAARAVARP